MITFGKSSSALCGLSKCDFIISTCWLDITGPWKRIQWCFHDINQKIYRFVSGAQARREFFLIFFFSLSHSKMSYYIACWLSQFSILKVDYQTHCTWTDDVTPCRILRMIIITRVKLKPALLNWDRLFKFYLG